MRVYILYIFIAILLVYAWKDWFVSLCGLMLLTATIGHQDMPRSILGITGLNAWNIVFLNLVAAWGTARQRTGYPWDMPSWAKNLFLAYVIVRLIALLRCAIDQENWQGGLASYSMLDFINDYLINSLKYLVPPIMFFDACRSRRRQIIGLLFVLLIPTYYAFIVYRTSPLSILRSYGREEERNRRRIAQRIGFGPNSVAMCCAAGFWGVVALTSLRGRGWQFATIIAVCTLILLAILLCRSRAGYWGFLGVGLLFAVFLYRSLFIILPIISMGVLTLFPGVFMRLTVGAGIETASGETVNDLSTMTAGRSDAWPTIIDYCWTSPVLGHGLKMTMRTPLCQIIIEVMKGELLGHPHNGYLELWLELGMVGVIINMAVYGTALVMGIILALDRRDKLYRVFGGALIAGTGSLLIMGFSGQSFMPKENNQMIWCLMGLGLRVWVERARKHGAGHHPDEQMVGDLPIPEYMHSEAEEVGYERPW